MQYADSLISTLTISYGSKSLQKKNDKKNEKNMNRFVLIVCIAVILAPLGLYAQKVYKDGDKVILDMTVEAGMPVGAVTDESKTYWYNSLPGGTPRISYITVIENADNNARHKLNATVYQKLEISKNDLGPISWVNAFNYCKNTEGTDWRLPTQRELMMMYIFKTALDDLFDIDFSSAFYWSSTEFNSSQAWNIQFVNGRMLGGAKTFTTGYRVRCVREVPETVSN